MAQVSKIDSNFTELRYAEEVSIGVLPGSPVWVQLDPNDYSEFGGKIKTVARNPINSSRQRKKGVVVDLDATGGFGIDMTQDNIQAIVPAFLFSNLRTKNLLAGSAVVNSSHSYTVPSGGGAYIAGDLLWVSGAASTVNNGLKKVTSASSGSIVVTDTAVVDETATLAIQKVGIEFAVGIATIDASGSLPKLVASGGPDLTTYGLVVGEWVCVGDDASGNKFATSVNNGLKRIRAITATSLTFDKSSTTMATDAGTGKTVRIFFGAVAKNEHADSSYFKRHSYQFERSLGYPDDASPTLIQYEYLTGCIADKLEIDVKQAAKVEMKTTFMARDHETNSAATGPKTGSRPTLQDSDAFNATSHVVRLSMAVIDPASANPSDLFAYITDLKLTIDNGVKANKAVKFLGAFDNTAGTLKIDANCTAYFADVAAIQTVRDNADVTMDFTFAQHNKGITFDMPLLSVGNALAQVKQDEAIMIPVENAAATGAKIDTNLDYTLLCVFWNYLPSLAA